MAVPGARQRAHNGLGESGAMAGNPTLKKHVVSDEEAAYNFKMASEKNALYAEAQPDLDYEFAMAGEGVIEKGVESQKIDHGL